ncbi:MAG: sel1 repeat family protein [Bacteroidaceae bacterium]|nr:sel1 repeat family protein [Bacteroidaceae bacterium]
MRTFITTLLLMLCIVARAQSADALYDEGKKLYDAKKYEQAFKKLLPAAQKGHKKAQYRVGRSYDKGHGVTEDNQKAYQWYLKSSQQGYGKAQYQLAKCYMKGKGTAKDTAKAKTWMLKAMQNDKAKEKYKEDLADGDKTAIALKKLIGK